MIYIRPDMMSINNAVSSGFEYIVCLDKKAVSPFVVEIPPNVDNNVIKCI